MLRKLYGGHFLSFGQKVLTVAITLFAKFGLLSLSFYWNHNKITSLQDLLKF